MQLFSACEAVADPSPMWTDVVSAVSTGFAAVIALVLGAYSLRVALRERSDRIQREIAAETRDREAREAEKRSQAERVTAWMEARTSAYPANRIMVDNASGQPIWDVEVVHQALAGGVAPIPVIPAMERHIVDVNSQGEILPAQVVEVTFRDNRGVRWGRNASVAGSLAEKQSPVGAPSVKQGSPE